LIATVEIAGLDPELMQECGGRVPPLAHLAVDDDRAATQVVEMVPNRVDRYID
jgi:hypothetical protein